MSRRAAPCSSDGPEESARDRLWPRMSASDDSACVLSDCTFVKSWRFCDGAAASMRSDRENRTHFGQPECGLVFAGEGTVHASTLYQRGPMNLFSAFSSDVAIDLGTAN